MTEQPTIRGDEDPVCGMRVDRAVARAADLVLDHGTGGYSFCSPVCLAQFRDDPAWFLDPAYVPTIR